MAWAAHAFTLVAAEEALLQLVAVWPGPPQNKQRLLSRLRCRSCFGKGIGRGGGQRCFVGFVVIAVLVALGVVGVVVRGARVVGGIVLAFVVRLFAFISFIVGFVVRLALARAGFLSDMFPVTGVDSVCKKLHGIESSGLHLVTHDVLDLLSKTGVVAMTKNVLVPTGMDGETIELNVVFDNALIVVLYLQVVDGVFGISDRIDGTKMSAKVDNECRPIVHPRRVVVRVNDGWFKAL